jgi:hypothetical protein
VHEIGARHKIHIVSKISDHYDEDRIGNLGVILFNSREKLQISYVFNVQHNAKENEGI